MGVVDTAGGATRGQLALHTAAGLTITALGIVGFQSITVVYGGGHPAALVLGLTLLLIAVLAGYNRTLWLSAAGFLMAIPLLLLFAIGLMLPMGGSPPPGRLIDAWWLSLAVTVGGIAIAMLALSRHVVVWLLEADISL